MKLNNSILQIITFFFMGCNSPYTAFSVGDKSVFVCGQDGKAIVTNTPCNQQSTNHLLLTLGGFTGGMALYANFCDNSHDVKVFGEFDVIGEPEFSYEIINWGFYPDKRDSLDNLYSNSECRHIYKE